MAISLVCSGFGADGLRLGNCLGGVARGEGEGEVSESKWPSLVGVVEREVAEGEGEERGRRRVHLVVVLVSPQLPGSPERQGVWSDEGHREQSGTPVL